ncbi:MAG: hypothetical protein CMD92_06145 [Gammaproteobacteria bacterium]|nr:hypothetical protein [Gammaproteobacteria bacterium]
MIPTGQQRERLRLHAPLIFIAPRKRSKAIPLILTETARGLSSGFLMTHLFSNMVYRYLLQRGRKNARQQVLPGINYYQGRDK